MMRPIGERPTTVRARAPALSPSAPARSTRPARTCEGAWKVAGRPFQPRCKSSPTSIVCVAVHSLKRHAIHLRLRSVQRASDPSRAAPAHHRGLSTWGKGGTAPGLTSSRSYRGSIVPKDADVVYEPPLLTKLEELKARLLRMKAAEPAEPEPEFEESGLLIGSMWMTAEYDSCAKYAGEASKVAASGRLPFGSDSKKMGPF